MLPLGEIVWREFGLCIIFETCMWVYNEFNYQVTDGIRSDSLGGCPERNDELWILKEMPRKEAEVSDSIGGYYVSAGIYAQVDRSMTVDWVLWK